MNCILKIAIYPRDLAAVHDYLTGEGFDYRYERGAGDYILMYIECGGVLGMAGRCFDIGQAVARIEAAGKRKSARAVVGEFKRQRSRFGKKSLWI